MPETSEILDILGAILGDEDLLRPADEPWDLGRVSAGTYITCLCNGEGETLGAVATDLNATICLGGRLVMMPEAGLADKARRLEVDEALTDAVTEIVNMTRIVFNRLPGNEHLSPLPARAMKTPRADGGEAWLLEPSARLDLAGECSFGALRIAILFR
ncbi:hypothetical protein KKG45_05220 [bacterium]|nr:hypothetical protein [bacterium]MBU1072629.1 hypothetical protein [bacterium]MBU1675539.1 hypothetical protein [bacterium]